MHGTEAKGLGAANQRLERQNAELKTVVARLRLENDEMTEHAVVCSASHQALELRLRALTAADGGDGGVAVLLEAKERELQALHRQVRELKAITEQVVLKDEEEELYQMQAGVQEQEAKVTATELTFTAQQSTLKQEIASIDGQVTSKERLLAKLTAQSNEFTKMKSLYEESIQVKEGELSKAQREREARLGKLDSKLSSSKEEASRLKNVYADQVAKLSVKREPHTWPASAPASALAWPASVAPP